MLLTINFPSNGGNLIGKESEEKEQACQRQHHKRAVGNIPINKNVLYENRKSNESAEDARGKKNSEG